MSAVSVLCRLAFVYVVLPSTVVIELIPPVQSFFRDTYPVLGDPDPSALPSGSRMNANDTRLFAFEVKTVMLLPVMPASDWVHPAVVPMVEL